jgi:hypothetical protein
MRQWKSSCISKHIRKGKADHSIGITGDSLTSSTSATWSRTSPYSLVPQLQGVLWRRARILKQVGVLKKEVVSLRVQLAALACTSYRPGGGAQLAELQEQLALAEDDHDQRLVAREQRHISPSSASEQAGKALTREPCAAGPRASGPAQELFTEPLNRAKEEEKWVSFSKRAINHA